MMKKPWPTKDAMEQVYEMNLWGNNGTDFYSGLGSHHPEMVTPYVDVVRSFLTSFEEPLIVCDLGCGDFNVGKELILHSKKYVGIDIVPGLIERNRSMFKHDNLEFICLDISKDDLPSGECALIRNVLQHLSNNEVQGILERLKSFKYAIITEHIPDGNFTANVDIISGQGIRLKKGSGVDVLAPPFNFQVKEEIRLLSTVVDDFEGVNTTTLYILDEHGS